jgi:hypothetical protein
MGRLLTLRVQLRHNIGRLTIYRGNTSVYNSPRIAEVPYPATVQSIQYVVYIYDNGVLSQS